MVTSSRTSSPVPQDPAGIGSIGLTLSQLGWAVSRQMATSMAALGIEPRHFALLGRIAADGGEPQNAIGDALSIPASSMVALVDQLEGRGLVARHVHPDDRRVRTLHVTPEGEVVLHQATAMAAELEHRLCAGLSPEEQRILRHALGVLLANFGLDPGVHPPMSAPSEEDGDPCAGSTPETGAGGPGEP